MWQIANKHWERRRAQRPGWTLPREVRVDPGSGDLSFVFASAKNQLCDLGSYLWTLISSSVPARGGLNSSSQCVDCCPEQEIHVYITPRHAHIQMHTYVTEPRASRNSTTWGALWYFLFYSLLFHCLKNARLDLLNGFHNPLKGHALWLEKTQNAIISEVSSVVESSDSARCLKEFSENNSRAVTDGYVLAFWRKCMV